MMDIVVDGVSAETVAAIEARAAKHGRTFDAEVLEIIEQAVGARMRKATPTVPWTT